MSCGCNNTDGCDDVQTTTSASGKKISQLNTATQLSANDLFVVVDVNADGPDTADETKNVTLNTLMYYDNSGTTITSDTYQNAITEIDNTIQSISGMTDAPDSETYIRSEGLWVQSDQFTSASYYTSTEVDISLNTKADTSALDGHTSDYNNPHQVTKTQVGLSVVDNTSDADKPISDSTQDALNLKTDTSAFESHTTDYNNPHQVNKDDVGLSAVDNTSDTDKQISDLTQTALDLKADTSALDSKEDYLGTATNGYILATSGAGVRYWIDGGEAGIDDPVDTNTYLRTSGAWVQSDSFNSSDYYTGTDVDTLLTEYALSGINLETVTTNGNTTTKGLTINAEPLTVNSDFITSSNMKWTAYAPITGHNIPMIGTDGTVFVTPDNHTVWDTVTDKLDANLVAQPNGVASLDGTGTVPFSQLPDAVLGALEYKGVWDAGSNNPTLSAGSGTSNGEYYKVGTSGTTDIDNNTDWQVGDWVINVETSATNKWDKIDQSETVSSVNGYVGAVNLDTDDIADTFSTQHKYVTNTNLTVINATSGVNSGDETIVTIQDKRPLKTVDGKTLEGTGNVVIDGLIPTGGTGGQVIIKDGTTPFVYSWQTLPGGGDMLASTYDTGGVSINGSVDNARKVNSLTVETAVPTSAVFTDTTYTVQNGELSEINFTTAKDSKLTGIDANANLYVLPSDVVQDASYEHTDNNYTTTEKNKLAGLENYVPLSGNTSAVPSSPANGTIYFGDNLGYPIWYRQDVDYWVNATGAYVVAGS